MSRRVEAGLDPAVVNDTDNLCIVDFPLSEHFSFYELTTSANHPDLVSLNRELALQNLIVMRNLRALCESILEPMREVLGGVPRRVLSGYRCAKLNGSIPGSSVNSQHMRGEAGDIAVSSETQDLLLTAVVPVELHDALHRNGKIVIPFRDAPFTFHQLRFYPGHGFVHAALPMGYRDMQVSVGCK